MVKRLIGGLVLLNLTSISLGLTSGEVDITDAGVLEQRKEVRTFIDVKRDFSKESKELKPVLVQYRSSVSKIDGVVQCNMQFNTDALHLNICGTSIQKDGTPITITINVVYEYTDYVGYTIKTAKLNATQNQPIFETIVDKNGHSRFIEDDGTPKTITGMTSSYCKWSLSGTHLMLVFAGNFADECTLNNSPLCEFAIPKWIYDKIYPVWLTYVEQKKISCVTDDWSDTDNIDIVLDKSNNKLSVVQVGGSVVFDGKHNFRIVFDLMIDNEDEE